jgi:hypothetical protein
VYNRAMTSAAHALSGLGAAVLISLSIALPAAAQVVDTSKTRPVPPVVRADSGKPLTVPAPVAARIPLEPLGGLNRKPPITPKRAFLYSLMIPGWGQSRLDRGTAGALFAAVELGSVAMIAKSQVDLRQSRRYTGDSLPGNYQMQNNGQTIAVGSFPPQFSSDLVRTRRLHAEDWYAAILFNHLLSGADAFVAAQLWDSTPRVAIRPHSDGVALVASIRW